LEDSSVAGAFWLRQSDCNIAVITAQLTKHLP
jgi:hypothetical protein